MKTVHLSALGNKKEKKMKKALVLLLVMLLSVAAVFASGATESSAEHEEVDLRIGWWGDQARHDATLAAIDLFEAQYPWIHVEAEYQGWDGWQTKFFAQVASGTVPDVTQDAGQVTYVVKQGAQWTDLRPYVEDGTIDISNFSQSLLEAYCTDSATGMLYLLPTGIQAWTTLQNNDLLAKNGIEMPADGWTWEEIIPAAKKLHESDPEAYMMNVSLETLTTWMLPMYIQQKVGGCVITDDSYLQFSVEDLQDYFQWVKDMFDCKGFQPRNEAQLYDGSPLENPKWAGGKLAISQFSSASYSWYILNDYLRENTEVVQTLKFKGPADNDTIVVPPASFWSIPASCQHPKEAAMLINFLLNDIEAGKALQTVRSIPANSAVLAALNEANLVDPGIARAVELGSPRACVKRGSSAVGNDITLVYQQYIEELAYGRMDAATAAAACYAEVTKLCDSVH